MLKTVGNPSTRYGDQTITEGNLVIGTAGKGVDFSADSHASGMTSELLDDYEEGTFTPTLGGSSGNPTVTYSYQAGYYTKVGRLVTVYLQVYTSSYSGGSGDLMIRGLPFAATNGTRLNINTARITFGAVAVQACAAMDGGATAMYFDESNSGLNDTVIPLSAWNSGLAAGITVFGSYMV